MAPVNMVLCGFNPGNSSPLQICQGPGDVLGHSLVLCQASSKGELGLRKTLVGGKSEVSNSFPCISINSVAFCKAEDIPELSHRIIVIGSKFEILSSFSHSRSTPSPSARQQHN
jgi:hypothetical protein